MCLAALVEALINNGKTTFAALVARHLRTRHRDTKLVIVSLFMQQYIDCNELSILEDILTAILEQLHSSTAELELNAFYQKYHKERYKDEGCRSIRRVQLLRQALQSSLAILAKDPVNKVFFVFDGFDMCNTTLKYLLEAELANWQSLGASVMLTSRLPVFENPLTATCDDKSHVGRQRGLNFYLQCRSCSSVLCFPCKELDRTCDKW